MSMECLCGVIMLEAYYQVAQSELVKMFGPDAAHLSRKYFLDSLKLLLGQGVKPGNLLAEYIANCSLMLLRQGVKPHNLPAERIAELMLVEPE